MFIAQNELFFELRHSWLLWQFKIPTFNNLFASQDPTIHFPLGCVESVRLHNSLEFLCNKKKKTFLFKTKKTKTQKESPLPIMVSAAMNVFLSFRIAALATPDSKSALRKCYYCFHT